MKKLITILTLLLISQVLFAQAPQATSYQAVIRNSIGNVLTNQLVKVRFSIHDSAANGTVVYQETQTPTTNAQGLINLFAGQGIAITGTFAGINWGSKSKFLQTEIDIAGGNNYTDMGTMQLMSVPYALYANTSSNGMPSGTNAGEMLYWNGTTWVKINPGTNGQNLTFCNGVPQWGPCLILPTVLTGSITAKTAITATAGGNVTDSGSARITERGVCFSTTINPTIANTKTVSGTNVIGAYTVSLTGLSALTTYHYRAYAITSVGTSYGADSVFTTNAATIPTLTTTAASAITGITATSGGNITSDNGATITARGICWSTTANPTTALTTKTVDGIGAGAFSSSITGLTTNTLYYVRAYATNSAGTAYGTQVTFNTLRLPAVTTGAVSNITSATVTASGNVTDSGSRAITARGLCYSTTPSPTITNGTVVANGTNAIGAYTVSLTGLLANTRYYVRAYVTTSVGTSYGVDTLFTTASAVTVANLPSVTIGSQTWASQNLSVSRYRNGDTIPQVTDLTQWKNLTTGAWCWYNNDSATYGATYGRMYNCYAVNDVRGLAPQGWHVSSVSDWKKLVKFIDNAADTSCANCIQSSIAGGSLKSITGWYAPNSGATNSTGFTALPGGNRSSNFGNFDSVGYYGFWWSSGNVNQVLGINLNFYDSYLFSSLYNKGYGMSVRLVKDSISVVSVPTVSTTSISSINTTSSISGGLITNDGGAMITAKGICWSTTANPTISLTTKTLNGTGAGSFTSSITGLTPNTLYHVRAYATNSLGTSYGSDLTFTTLPIAIPTVTTTSISSILNTTATIGGNITSDGGSTITSRGVCWSTSANPTISLNTKTIDGAGTGTFTSNITGLIPNTRYYVRAYATNSMGTAYGVENNFTTTLQQFTIGMDYGVGKIIYILQPGDLGYVSGETHGLIIAQGSITNQLVGGGCGIFFSTFGCQGTSIGNTSTSFGSGPSNTSRIASICGPGTAAYFCDTLSLNGYNDWFLPSTGELTKVYQNYTLVGGVYPQTSQGVWSSSEINSTSGYVCSFDGGGGFVSLPKNSGFCIKALRRF